MDLKRIFICLLFLLLFVNIGLRSESAVYQWQTHFSYSQGVTLTETASRVYFAPVSGLMYYDKSDGSMNIMSKASGLSDLNVGVLEYNGKNDAVFVGYTNANIDIIKGNVIKNIPDIKNKDITANKALNNIRFYGDNAYICTGFGIVVIDIAKEEIRDTYLIGEGGAYVNVHDFACDDTYFYATTDNGIYRADKDSKALFISSSWSKIKSIGDYRNIVWYEDKLLVVERDKIAGSQFDDKVYQIVEDTVAVRVMEDEIFAAIYRMSISEGKLLINADTKFRVFDKSLELTATPWSLTWSIGIDAVASGEYYYIATTLTGLVRCKGDGSSLIYISPNGPVSNMVFRMSSYKDQLWVSAGGYSSTMAADYSRYGVYSYIDNKWQSYSPSLLASMPGSDYICVAVSPIDSKRVFIGTYGYGILELYDGILVNQYDDKNSTLQQRYGKYGVCITGLAFDDNGDLWIANSDAPNSLHVMRKNKTWEKMEIAGLPAEPSTGPLVIDKSGQKWVLTPRTANTLLVFSKSGKEAKQLTGTTGNGGLNGGRIHSIAIDNNGEAWLGSDDGVLIISNPANIFRSSGNYDAKRVVYDGRYLFENTLITSLAVDGENKKWVGTDRSGAYLISSDGKEQIYEFTAKDSPLISDNIVAIAINSNGEVFFGTDKGIVSYKDNTRPIDPTEEDFDIKVYPNPVKPDYTGTIAIDNIPANGSVKITDAGGRLVYSTKAQGTRAVWNGDDMEGKRAATGVYFIQVVGEDTKQKAKGKVVFIN